MFPKGLSKESWMNNFHFFLKLLLTNHLFTASAITVNDGATTLMTNHADKTITAFTAGLKRQLQVMVCFLIAAMLTTFTVGHLDLP